MTKPAIMIVEDEAVIAMEIRSELIKLGYRISSIAHTGEKAIEQAVQNRPDLILMDINLQGTIDGIQVAAQIRDELNTPIVFLTAYADDHLIDRAKAIRPYGYIIKPFELVDLKVAIELALHVAQIDAERSRTEQLLRESESRNRALLQAIPDMIIRYDRAGTAIDFKLPTYFPSLTEPDKIVGKKISEILPPPLADLRQKYMDQALETGDIQVYEQEVQFPDRPGYEEVRLVASGEDEVIAIIRDISERHEAQMALAESEERYRMVSELVTDYVYAVRVYPGGDFELMFATAAFLRLLDIDPDVDDTSGLNWLDWIHPDDHTAFLQIMQRTIDHGEAYAHEYRIVRSNGELHWLHDAGRPVDWQGPDQPFMIYGASKDITEQRSAEEKLRQRDELLQKLSEQAPGVICQFRLYPDGHSQMPYTSEAIRDIYELTPEQVKDDATPLFDVVHPDDYDHLVGTITHSAETLLPWRCEYRVILPKKGLRWIHGESSPEKLADGSILWYGYLQDITQRKQTEETLRFQTYLNKSLAQLAAEILASNLSIEHIADMVYELALELTGSKFGFVSSIDPLTADNVSHTHKTFEVIDQPVAFSKGEKGYKGLWGHALNTRRAFFTNQPVNHPAAKGTPAGHAQLDNFLSAPALANNQLLGQIALANAERPYTKKDLETVERLANVYALAILRKRYEDELIVAKEKTEAANRAKSEFLAKMSHELRTPLNAIMGYAQILQNEPSLNSAQRNDAEIIHRSGEHLLVLINDVLDLAKIEAGRTELREAELHLPTFLQTMVDMFRVRASQTGIEFKYDTPTTLPEGIVADERHLRQVVINLLGNAVKFTKTGHVRFKVEAIAPTGGDKNGQTADNQITLRFEVDDTGPGIRADKLTEIFEPFRQVDPQDRFVEGTGLGLAISQRLAELMGSTIQVKSEPGKGSCFWLDVTVPVTVMQAETAPGKAQNLTGVDSSSVRILVVDDVMINQKLLVKALTKRGFDVVTAKDGADGLQQAQQHRPDIILTDVQMPVMDGLEMTRQLRQSEQFKETTIIAISAGAFEEDRQKCLAAGCDDYLAKPINMGRLLEILEEHYPPLRANKPVGEKQATSAGKEQQLPSPETIQLLFELADCGDFRGVLEKLDEIEETHGCCAAFVAELRDLAERFEVDRLRLRIEHYLERNDESQ